MLPSLGSHHTPHTHLTLRIARHTHARSTLPATPQLSLLRQQVKFLRLAGLAPSSRQQYTAVQRLYVTFLSDIDMYHKRYDMDWVAREGLPLWAAHLALNRGIQASTIGRYINGAIRDFYLQRGYRNPARHNHIITSIIAATRRRQPTENSRRKLAITPSILRRIAETTDQSNPKQVASMTAACFALFAALRKSNVSTESAHGDETTHKAPRACDIWTTDNDTFIWIRLHHTKTIQFRERILDIPIYVADDTPINALTWLRLHRTLSPPTHPSSHAFAYRRPNGTFTNLTHRDFIAFTKQSITRIGLKATDYAGHSYRRGGATHAARCHAPIHVLKTLGDWKSDAYLLYVEVAGSMLQTLARDMASA